MNWKGINNVCFLVCVCSWLISNFFCSSGYKKCFLLFPNKICLLSEYANPGFSILLDKIRHFHCHRCQVQQCLCIKFPRLFCMFKKLFSLFFPGTFSSINPRLRYTVKFKIFMSFNLIKDNFAPQLKSDIASNSTQKGSYLSIEKPSSDTNYTSSSHC